MNEADELARRVADRLHAREGTSPAWGVEIEEVREGYARIAMIVRKDMLNGKAITHGGMIFTLADTAFAYACNSRNVNTVAQSATIAFRGAGAGRATGWWRRPGRRAIPGRSGVYAVKVRNQNGENIAVFQGLSRSIGGAILDGIN